ncbi:NAD(+)/NADH kinase [Candidatus Woesearchaeota archaeon]|nr:NAD(+)/NADH kinase [Candidatus Woesearchaeota archaeon]
MKFKKVLVVCHKDYHKAVSVVMNALADEGISSRCVDRDLLSAGKLRGSDLVISVGGDGTLLRTSHHLSRQSVLCVSPNPKVNEGFFARACVADFREKLKLLLKGKFRILSLNRLEAVISYGKMRVTAEPALNEVFIGSMKPYQTARYILKVGRRSEFQKSSGVLVSTAAGSNAWLGSAGGKKLPVKSGQLQFRVREPYTGRLTKPKLKGGVLPKSASVSIKSLSWHGIIAIDSIREYPFREGAAVTIRSSKVPLRLVGF